MASIHKIKGKNMLKKVISGFLVLATSTLFGMNLSQINKASKSDLMEINGIGDVKAAAIMKARPFKSFDDLAGVTGVGSQLVANVKGDVKNASDVKKVTKTTKKTTTKADKKTSKTKSKTDATKEKASKTKTKADKSVKDTKKRKIKSMDDKKKELKTKAKKTKTKKTKAKKEKKTKTKTK